MKIKTTYSALSLRVGSFIDRAKMTEHTFMIIIAIIIGILGGFAGVGIRALIKGISLLFFPGNGSFLENVLHSPWYIVLFAPIVGGLLVGPIIHFFAPEAKGHGVPEVMEAILLKGGRIRPIVVVIKAIASAISIGSGGSVGREGPIVQIGSSLGSTIGQFFKVPTKKLKTLVGCGAGAGIAAAFNAPIAGALFAVEIILMDFAVAQFSPIVIASVMATVVSHAFQGNFAAFEVTGYQLISPYEMIFYFVLGGFCGLVSYAFIKTLYFLEDFFDNKFKIPPYLKPFVGGIAIGVIGLLAPQIMGVGYDSINEALHNNIIWYFAFALIFIKIVATSITLGSGGSGGIFAPSLFMGAMCGAFFGHFVHQLYPDISATAGAYALVAMGGLVAGTTRAPITAIIIVFELTKDYNIILPLMITCIISMIISSKLSRESIYTLKLILRNINIKEGQEINIIESIFVNEVYDHEFYSIGITDDFAKVIKSLIQGKDPEYPVVDSKNNVKGMISIYDIKEYLYDRDALKNLLIAGDIARTNFPFVTTTESCQAALDKMRQFDLEGIPVVLSKDNKKLLGMLWLKDIQDAYQKEVERRDITSTLASSITMKDSQTQVHFWEGYSISEISAPKSFVGKSIRQLNIRTIYGVDVLSIKTNKNGESKINAIPNPEYIIRKDDILIVAGEIKNINLLKNID